MGRAGTSVSLTFQRGSDRDESYGFYQVKLTRGHLNVMKNSAGAAIPSAVEPRAFQSVNQGSFAGSLRPPHERSMLPSRSFEHRAMVSLDATSPALPSNPSAPPVRSTLAAAVTNAAPSSAAAQAAAAEAAALLDVLERVLRDSDLRSQQAGFATLLRDFDLCVIKRSSS